MFSAPFHDAVASFLQQESEHIVAYFNQAQDVLPFNNDITPTLKTTNTTNPLLAVNNHNEKTI
nr:GNAT family N-acetyltransferase [Alteromonas stellipolaris]